MVSFDLTNSSYSQTQKEILEGAFRALRKASYSEVSINDVGAEQGHSTGLIYYHFDDKDRLFLELATAMAAQLKDTLESIQKESAKATLSTIAYTVAVEDEDSQDFYTVLFDLRSQGFLRAEYREYAGEISASILTSITTVVQDCTDHKDSSDATAKLTGLLLQRLECQLLFDSRIEEALEAEIQRTIEALTEPSKTN
ncbi:TetR/AcrR family transcriptional regulator [Haloferax profundi]|uniref:HTH tetR-type domain-containing protein n=1 Tax=Haloferax profundi TaxID=1544718 RepID=A0A0W1SMV9_9EURY|nr:TetR/AcrR family transcriptional regulator [Haloferax profundi]KTG27098.1 hypothetical protein AUR66_00615 [Haloferax profundi]